MIVVEEAKDLLTIHAYGELTIEDFREFEKAISDELNKYPRVDLLLDLTNMTGFTLDVAIEDVQFNRQHLRDFGRIAIVTDNQWLSWMGWLSGIFTGADVQTFSDPGDAATWLAEAV